jgi:opacity protein-like surface antigen
MKPMKFFLLAAMLLCPMLATAQLAVAVTPPKVTGQKAVVQLKMKNGLGEAVKSARAVCFLLDDQGKMVGQSTKWVVGQNHTGLEPKAEATFNFVITSPQPWTTTNLAAKISFSRVVLDSGKLADVKQNVSIVTVEK